MSNHSSEFFISHVTFNSVNGNQINNFNNSETDARFSPEEEWKVDLYQEYKRIPTGDCKLERTIHESTVVEYEFNAQQWKVIPVIEGTRVFSVARLGRGQDEPCLMSVGYTGRDAKKLFKRDCMTFSRIKHVNIAQLYAFNDSRNNPTIFFHDELIPMAHVLQRHSDCRDALMRYIVIQDAWIFPGSLPPYADSWSKTWIRPQDGMIVYGPEGPPLDVMPPSVSIDSAVGLARWYDPAPPIPMNFYNHQTIVNYLSTWLLEGFLPPQSNVKYPSPSLLRSFHSNPGVLRVFSVPPHVIAELPEASGMWELRNHSEIDTVLMDDGRIRVLINRPCTSCHLLLDMNDFHKTRLRLMWLAQALHVFKMHNIQQHDWENYGYLEHVNLSLEADGPFKSMRLLSGLYLFVCPRLQSSDGIPHIQHWICGTNVCYWSTDPDGHSEMTEEQRIVRGLPCYSAKLNPFAISTWSLDDYDFIRDIQIARGFDPSTMNFACSLGYPLFKVVCPQEGRFEEVPDDSESEEDTMEVNSHSPGSYEVLGEFSSSVGGVVHVEFEDTDIDMEDCHTPASQLGDEVEMEVDC